jgi:sn-glycerol 3-phosphate transport system permease protein
MAEPGPIAGIVVAPDDTTTLRSRRPGAGRRDLLHNVANFPAIVPHQTPALLRHATAIGAVALFAFPLVWMVSTSLKAAPDVFIFPPIWLSWPPQFENYQYVWGRPLFGRYVLNSLVTATLTILLQSITVSTAAYAFARLRFRYRELIFVLFLGAMILPVQVTIIPSFLLLSALGWIDTYWALTIPFGASAIGIFLVRQAFLTVPAELVDAARIDGASHVQILLYVMLPLAQPILLTFVLLSFTWRWNDYLWPLIMTTSAEMRTLTVGIVLMQAGDGPRRWHVIMAATVLTVAPTLLLYFAVQRRFIESIVRTGLKG